MLMDGDRLMDLGGHKPNNRLYYEMQAQKRLKASLVIFFAGLIALYGLVRFTVITPEPERVEVAPK